jgi:hypothetical protein
VATKGKVAKVSAAVAGAAITALLASTAFLKWSFHHGVQVAARFDFHAFGAALGRNAFWLVGFTALSAAMLPLRALQWQATLEKKVPFSERWHFVNIGAAVHNLFPGNLGDVTRAFLLARTRKLPFVTALGSVAVCKLFELAALLLMVALALVGPASRVDAGLSRPLRTATFVCLGLVAAAVATAFFAEPLAKRLRWKKAQALLRQLAAGFHALRSPKRFAQAFAASFPPQLAAAVAYAIGLAAMGGHGGFLAGIVVLGMIAIGEGTPGLPTGPGMYFLMVSLAGRRLGLSDQDAAAYALLTNVATGLSHWIPGVVSLAVRRISWSELKRATRGARLSAEQASGSVPAESSVR